MSTPVNELAPVLHLPTDYTAPPPQPGMALALSGGGYRAMLFHLGALVRLNQVGLLAKLKRISSVSGGSITAGVLGLKWTSLKFEGGVASNFEAEVVSPVRRMADQTIDIASALEGIVLPGTISSQIEKSYDDMLFKGATLQNLPDDAVGPRFVINSTSLQTGVLFRFSKPFMADYLVGIASTPNVPLAKAVTASSAFPPFLSPCVLDLNPADFQNDAKGPLCREPFISKAVLTDGGVYDNLGIETVWKDYQTILVSDAGAKMKPDEEPHHDWVRQPYRILEIVDNQVRSLRKRQIIALFKDTKSGHNGTYWGIKSHVKDYGLADVLDCPEVATQELAATPTRLAKLDPVYQERLINWGYGICDTAIRAHIDRTIKKGTFPYPSSPI